MSTIYVIAPDSAILGGLIELLRSLQPPVCGFTCPDQFLAADHDPSGGFVVVDSDAREVVNFQFLRQMRERNIALPTVLLSSRADNTFKARAISAGAIDVIDKPLVNELLLARIRQWLLELTPRVPDPSIAVGHSRQ